MGRCAFANRARKPLRRKMLARPLPASRWASGPAWSWYSSNWFSAALLSEVNPQSDNGGQQRQAEDDIEAMFHRRLVRGLALRYADGDGFHFVIHSCEGQAGEAPTVRSRGHQADSDQHHRTDHEHENRVM